MGRKFQAFKKAQAAAADNSKLSSSAKRRERSKRAKARRTALQDDSSGSDTEQGEIPSTRRTMTLFKREDEVVRGNEDIGVSSEEENEWTSSSSDDREGRAASGCPTGNRKRYSSSESAREKLVGGVCAPN